MIFILNEYILSKKYKANKVEANLFSIKDQERFDKIILGISHGRNLSRGTHHQLFESIKGKTINLAIGDGLNGLEIQKLYASYFFKKGNVADTLYYVLSPPLFYNDHLDKNDFAFYKEPIKIEFISHLIEQGSSRKYNQLFHYIKSKLSHHWWSPIANPYGNQTKKLEIIDTHEVKKGIERAYPAGLDQSIFQDRCQIFEATLSLFIKHNVKIKVIIPPALFGKWPGHNQIMDFLHSKNLDVNDLSEKILIPRYYYDHHHLNIDGIKLMLPML